MPKAIPNQAVYIPLSVGSEGRTLCSHPLAPYPHTIWTVITLLAQLISLIQPRSIILFPRNLGIAWEGMLTTEKIMFLEDKEHQLGQAATSNGTAWDRKGDGQSHSV